ncbi:hypothetical protein PIB30_020379 [Stylosanthes scabra]|uniref:Uncharacterized protein n=1 Tax=Stylosanthes scabra TaxID=79078 RepID=A0ABU6QA31_9FABA|nr:hypothetical protein [Stylosanthes scabra]
MKEIAHAIVNTRPRIRQTSELFDAIRSLGVQDHKLFEAVDWLAEHPTSIDVFFGCLEELRLRWLYNKLGIHNSGGPRSYNRTRENPRHQDELTNGPTALY